MPFHPHASRPSGPSRRSFLQTLAGAGAAILLSPFARALAETRASSDEFFIFIHAAGGWDVTLWADPRNEKRGIVDPATTANTDTGALHHWTDQPFDGDVRSFKLLTPRSPSAHSMVFGPGIGNLIDHAERLCVVNGLAMNTVSHPDGTTFAATGRHLTGGRSPQASINTIMTNEFGLQQKFPSVSLQFPSSFAGNGLDRRAAPLVVDRVGSIGSTLTRSPSYGASEDREAVTALLSEEARSLATSASDAGPLEGLALQLGGLTAMLSNELKDVFRDGKLKAAHPEFNYKARFQGHGAINAAFVVEAMKRNLVRCVSFSAGGFDTHATNFKFQAETQQELFDLLAALLTTLDRAPHPTRTSSKLSEHTHVLVFSDFCRTPQINLAGGRDHYPNNSALVISPRFRGGIQFGASDVDQVLPTTAKAFADGPRPIAPPDLLATFVSAFGVDPRRYLRDGEVVPELLRGAVGA